MATTEMLIAGFGGQGVLFTGKIIAYTGLHDGREVSWLPSYGPEMRGGTANCSVTVSDDPIASPLVLTPQALIAMNVQSYEKFIGTVAPGGMAIIDSSLVDAKCDRTDIDVFYVPATKLAQEHELTGLANMIILGKLLKEAKFTSFETVEEVIKKLVPAKKQHLIEPNMKAIRMGMDL